jgi:lipid-binding SYLF domain-containing protein
LNNIRRVFAFGSTALALAATCIGFSARASDASDAKEIVDKATLTVGLLTADKDFASLGPALGKGVLVFPEVLKAGFVLGGSGGSGVLLVRDANTGDWGGPAFHTMGSASLGLQAGASSAEMVMVINSQKAIDSLYTNKLKLGGDVPVALGPKGAAAGGSASADFIIYAKAKGAFAGIAVDGSVLDVRQKLNAGLYGKPVTPVEILVKGEASNPESANLKAALKQAAK